MYFFDCKTDCFLPSPLFDDMIITYSHSFVIGKTVPILCKFIAMIQANYKEHQVSMGNAIRNQVSLTESKIDKCKAVKSFLHEESLGVKSETFFI